jgi:hypothetical protein
MNNNFALSCIAWLLALVAFALIALSPMLFLGYRLIVFSVAPALQAVSVLGH